ncbi:MAG: DUF4230 domain-containing protein [Bacteroidota bacterium]
MTKKIINVIILLGIFLLGVWVTRQFYQQPQFSTEENATVLIEKVREVCKLVTIEADLYELYDEKNLKTVTWYLPLPTNFVFSKKANIEVSGKVLVGYNLEKVEITADSLTRTLIIKNLPDPEIISIEHDVKYRNIEESFFNEFTPKDFTAINKRAKEILKQKALEQHLLEKAEAQGIEILEVIKFMGKGSGWNVEIQNPLFEDRTQRDTFKN